jgi:hypothetical protein
MKTTELKKSDHLIALITAAKTVAELETLNRLCSFYTEPGGVDLGCLIHDRIQELNRRPEPQNAYLFPVGVMQECESFLDGKGSLDSVAVKVMELIYGPTILGYLETRDISW